MDFKNDFFTLSKPSYVKFELARVKSPNDKDVFFRSKQQEIVELYSAARIFLKETETDDWKHWFMPVEDEKANEAFKLTFRADFYEAALFYYNAIVDMSWVLCYLAAEFACSENGKRVSLGGTKTIDEAFNLLRIAERNVTAPTAETNPFGYFKEMCPEFIPAIDMIIEFWNEFGASEIRKRYNFCKHKGRPSYIEIEKLAPGKVMGFYVKNINSGEVTEMVSDISDVRYSCSLEASIQQLLDFDNERLFPYLEKLLKEIEKILKPSPMIF